MKFKAHFITKMFSFVVIKPVKYIEKKGLKRELSSLTKQSLRDAKVFRIKL